jgi:hypothetical protein
VFVYRKVANYLGDVLEDQRDKLAENLLAAGVDLATYITQFRQVSFLTHLSSAASILAPKRENYETQRYR